jgi:LysR family glycine cleavage system transcriptional activator
MDPPNLLALMALEAVLRLGSVTRAADSLHLTQSAVSHRLHALQRELGVTLIERSGRGVRLTPRAEELARAAGVALAQLELAVQRAAPSRESRVLSISCSPSFAIRFLVARVSAFRAEHPQLDLRIAAADIPVDPGNGADASIHLSAAATPGLFCEKLVDEVVFPVASPRLLQRRSQLRPAELGKYALLHDEALANEPSRVGWATWLAKAGETGVDSTRGVRFSHAYLALEAALAGDGIALARRSLVADDLARGRLIAPCKGTVPSGLAYWFVSATDPANRPAIRALKSFLAQQLTAAKKSADKALRSNK